MECLEPNELKFNNEEKNSTPILAGIFGFGHGMKIMRNAGLCAYPDEFYFTQQTDL